MALIVEDGTGLSTSQAYHDAAYADAYFTARGIAAWTGSTTVKEQAIIRATDYIEARWGPLFLGAPLVLEEPRQALSFPRQLLYDRWGLLVEGVPEDLKKASCEYALRALTAELAPDPVFETGGVVQSKRTKVGPIEKETSYVGGAVVTIRPYPAADALIRQFVSSTNRAIRN